MAGSKAFPKLLALAPARRGAYVSRSNASAGLTPARAGSNVSLVLADLAARIVALSLDDPPGETMHWTGALIWRLRQFRSAHLACPRASAASHAAVQAVERSEVCRHYATSSLGRSAHPRRRALR